VGLPDLTPEDAVREIEECGYDGVEWRVTHVPDGVKGEEPSFWGNNLCTLEPTIEEAMRFARAAGAPQIRVGVGSPGGSAYAELFDAARRFLAQVEELAGEHGVKAVVEIHHGTICPSASLTHRLVSGLDPGLVGVIFDPGNMAREGFEDYRIGVELLGPYLAHVHLKNAAFEPPEGDGVWQPRWTPLEDGVVDFGALFEVLDTSGYSGWFVIEDFSAARPTREALEHNLKFIRSFEKSAPPENG